MPLSHPSSLSPPINSPTLNTQHTFLIFFFEWKFSGKSKFLFELWLKKHFMEQRFFRQVSLLVNWLYRPQWRLQKVNKNTLKYQYFLDREIFILFQSLPCRFSYPSYSVIPWYYFKIAAQETLYKLLKQNCHVFLLMSFCFYIRILMVDGTLKKAL